MFLWLFEWMNEWLDIYSFIHSDFCDFCVSCWWTHLRAALERLTLFVLFLFCMVFSMILIFLFSIASSHSVRISDHFGLRYQPDWHSFRGLMSRPLILAELCFHMSKPTPVQRVVVFVYFWFGSRAYWRSGGDGRVQKWRAHYGMPVPPCCSQRRHRQGVLFSSPDRIMTGL